MITFTRKHKTTSIRKKILRYIVMIGILIGLFTIFYYFLPKTKKTIGDFSYYVIENNSLIGLYILGLIISIISTFYFLKKFTPFFKNDLEKFIRSEKKEFLKKYGKIFFNTNKIVSRLQYWGMFSIMALFIFISFAHKEWITIYSTQIFIFSFLGLSIFISLSSIIKAKNVYQQTIEFLNKTLPKTNLEYQSNTINDLGHTIYGEFKGRKFNFIYNLIVQMIAGRRMRFYVKKSIKISVNLTKAYKFKDLIEIKEQNPKWNEINGKDLNDCFNKRFKISGNISNISSNLKKLLLNYERSFNLYISESEIVFKAKELVCYPFYTAEGEFLFIEFLTQICELLEETN